MTTTAPPPKIKAFLGQVKESVLDVGGDDASNVLSLAGVCALIVQLELAHRGVLLSGKETVNVKITDCDEAHIDNIWNAVRASAGKLLLDENSRMPKPLLAGLSAVTGRVSELCASLISEKKKVDSSNFGNTAALKDASKRCEEVQDDRLLTLLQIYEVAEKRDVDSANQLQLFYLTVAHGCYLRAATFQPDVPPMWKRAWDVVVAMRQQVSSGVSDPFRMLQPIEAVEPLSNLIRIAASKGNRSRVAELGLKLTESYLDESRPTDEAKVQKIRIAWVDPYKKSSMIDKQKLAELASNALRACIMDDMMNPDEDGFLYTILQARVSVARENTEIENEAQELYTLNKNRSATASIQKCRSLARIKILSSTETDEIFEERKALRDAVLARVFQSESLTSPMYTEVASIVLLQFVKREQERLKAISTKPHSKFDSSGGWIELARFVAPILVASQKSSKLIASETKHELHRSLHEWLTRLAQFEQALVRESALLLPKALWLSTRRHEEWIDLDAPGTFAFVHNILSALIAHAEEKRKAELATAGTIHDGTSQLDTYMLHLKCASASMKSILASSRASGSNETSMMADIRSVSSDAVHMYKKQGDRYEGHQKSYGMAFFQCIVAWSGMQKSAWSHCNIAEIRRIIARARNAISDANSEYGRRSSPIEELLIDIAHADAEGGLVSGGFAKEAEKYYNAVLERLSSLIENRDMDESRASLFRAHCYCGLARVSQLNRKSIASHEAEAKARQSLCLLEAIPKQGTLEGHIFIWILPSSYPLFYRNMLSVARQLVASTLVSSGKLNEAHAFLGAAVKDSPNDAEASFALGAFYLRMTMYVNMSSSSEEKRAAQIQLLKSAKLDATKASPFALIGVWFEEQNDTSRAIGCYTKALRLDPSHPVAGRGILRLQGYEKSDKMVEAASNTNSPSNGWAWRAIGLQKVMAEGNDDLAVVALSKALRCRDINLPQNEGLSLFFSPPSIPKYVEQEKVEALADLAMCYRRLGRYTASIRTFQAASESAGDNVSSSVLCSCAQVELELGLYDEATEKFARVLEREGDVLTAVAAYGHGQSLLSLARRDSEDGKAGSSFTRLQHAAESCEMIANEHVCAQKLLGDIYSFAIYLPPVVFVDEPDGSIPPETMVEAKTKFIVRGEGAYQLAIDSLTPEAHDEESKAVLASIICDLGSNILSQAHLLESLKTDNDQSDKEMDDAYDRSEKAFRLAIDTSLYCAAAWCGFGCAVVSKDPLLAQHAFCRSLQLNAVFPDAYANLGYLYGSKRSSFRACEGVMDALTQVADSPAMWINRAIILERNASQAIKVNGANGRAEAKTNISRAADAYRAALQVMDDPKAMLGLSLSCRVQKKDSSLRIESHSSLLKYLAMTGSVNKNASAMESVMALEKGAATKAEWGIDLAHDARNALQSKLDKIPSDGVLDAESIRACIAASPDIGSDDQSSADGRQISISLSRRVALDPTRADMWLQLALELSESDNQLESALLAARKAAGILRRNWLNGGETELVDASLFAKASSLVFWLESIRTDEPTQSTTSESKSDEELGVGETSMSALTGGPSRSDLQRSLMMNPCDPVARAALQML